MEQPGQRSNTQWLQPVASSLRRNNKRSAKRVWLGVSMAFSGERGTGGQRMSRIR